MKKSTKAPANPTASLAEFQPNPDNPQRYGDDEIAALVESIRKEPRTLGAAKIAFCTDYTATNGASYAGRRVVIAGNKRLQALQQIAREGGLRDPGDASAWLVSPQGDAPAAWFFDLTPLGPDARRHWLLESNIGRGEWDAEKLLAQFTRDELADHFDADALQEILDAAETDEAKDGKIRVFRLEANAERLQSTCDGIMMPQLPTEKFREMVLKVVKMNERFVPPYESGASLYIRPLLIGTGAQVGVHPADEYLFMIFVMPVGPYFKGGFATNPYVVIRQYDRSAPLGTGIYKVGGNYAASMKANKLAHDLGYSCEFYLDAKEKKYIDECGAANFFGIKENTYVTPKSTSILPSITNKSLMQLAEDMGLKVERRQIPIEELDTFEEAGACGTAAVISPIERIDDLEMKRSYVIAKDGKPGPICRKLYDTLRGIQYGDIEDRHGWVTVVE